LSALVYTLIGFGVGSFSQFTTGESVWTPVLVVGVASAVAEVSYALFAIMFGQSWISISDTAKVAGLVVLYNVLLTPFVFPIVRRIAARFRPERVYR
jgi:cell shape-determining protein MreD